MGVMMNAKFNKTAAYSRSNNNNNRRLFTVVLGLLLVSLGVAAGATDEASGRATFELTVANNEGHHLGTTTTTTTTTTTKQRHRALRSGSGGGNGRCDAVDGRSESFVFWCQLSWKLLIGLAGFGLVCVLYWYYRTSSNNKTKHKPLDFDEALSFDELYETIKSKFQEKSKGSPRQVIKLRNNDDTNKTAASTTMSPPKTGCYNVEYLEDNCWDEDKINDTIYLTFHNDDVAATTKVKSISGSRHLFTIDEGHINTSNDGRTKIIAWWLETQQQDTTTTADVGGGGENVIDKNDEIVQVLNWVTYDPTEKVFNGEWWSRSGLHGTLKAYYSIVKNKNNRSNGNHDKRINRNNKQPYRDEEAPQPSPTSSISSNDNYHNEGSNNNDNINDIYFGSSDEGIVSLHNVIRDFLNDRSSSTSVNQFGETLYREIRKQLGPGTRYFVPVSNNVDKQEEEKGGRGGKNPRSSSTWREVTYEEKKLVKLIRKEFKKLREENQ